DCPTIAAPKRLGSDSDDRPRHPPRSAGTGADRFQGDRPEFRAPPDPKSGDFGSCRCRPARGSYLSEQAVIFSQVSISKNVCLFSSAGVSSLCYREPPPGRGGNCWSSVHSSSRACSWTIDPGKGAGRSLPARVGLPAVLLAVS